MKINPEKLGQKLDELETQYKTAKAEADRVPGLESELKTANDKIAALEETQKNASAPAISQEDASKVAELLTERGILPAEQKQAFASSIAEDPAQLVDSIEKIANFATAAQMGDAAGDSMPLGAQSELDPIAKFALS